MLDWQKKQLRASSGAQKDLNAQRKRKPLLGWSWEGVSVLPRELMPQLALVLRGPAAT